MLLFRVAVVSPHDVKHELLMSRRMLEFLGYFPSEMMIRATLSVRPYVDKFSPQGKQLRASGFLYWILATL